jgi:tetratricopeptide (TPR) repeat protein
VAQHYRDAYEAVPDADDAAEVRHQAQQAFVRAGRRAMSVGAPEPAQRAFTVAIELTDDEEARAALLADAGEAAIEGGHPDEAEALLATAVAAHRAAGRSRAAVLATERQAVALAHQSHAEQAIALLLPTLAEVSEGEPDEVLARVQSRLAHLLYFAGRPDEAFVHVEVALELAQAFELPDVLCTAANIKGLYLNSCDRHEEAFAMLEWAAEISDRHALGREGGVAHGNAADQAVNADNVTAATAHLDATLAIGRRRGAPWTEGYVVYNRGVVDVLLGNWSAVEESATAFAQRFAGRPGLQLYARGALAQLHALRGESALAHADLECLADMATSEDVQDRAMHAMIAAVVAVADDDFATARQLATESVRAIAPTMGGRHECVRTAWPVAMDATLRLGDLPSADELLRLIADRPIGHVPPYLRAQVARFRARLAAAQGSHDAVEGDFVVAERMLTDLGYPYALACVQLDHGAWLVERGASREAVALLQAAESTFERLGARPVLARARELLATLPAVATV